MRTLPLQPLANRHAAMPRRRNRPSAVLTATATIAIGLMLATTLTSSALMGADDGHRLSDAAAGAARAAAEHLDETYAAAEFVDVANSYTLSAADSPERSVNRSTTVTFTGWTAPPVSSGFSASLFRAAHFDLASTATTDARVSVSVHGGAYQIAPRAR